MADEQKQPIPTDEIASLAGKVLSRHRITGNEFGGVAAPLVGETKQGVASATEGSGIHFVSADSYNDLLAEAKKLAGFVLNADPHEGSNAG